MTTIEAWVVDDSLVYTCAAHAPRENGKLADSEQLAYFGHQPSDVGKVGCFYCSTGGGRSPAAVGDALAEKLLAHVEQNVREGRQPFAGLRPAGPLQLWSIYLRDEGVRKVAPLCAAHSEQLQRMAADPRQQAELAGLGEEIVLLTPEKIASLSRKERRQLRRCTACAEPRVWQSVFSRWEALQ